MHEARRHINYLFFAFWRKVSFSGRKIRMRTLLGLALLLAATYTEAQCAMCRAVLESQEDQEAAKGVNNGIIYLMAVPYILIGGLGYMIYKTFRKNETSE